VGSFEPQTGHGKETVMFIGGLLKFLAGVTVVAVVLAGAAWCVGRLLNFTPDFGVMFQNIWWAVLVGFSLWGIFRFLTGRG